MLDYYDTFYFCFFLGKMVLISFLKLFFINVLGHSDPAKLKETAQDVQRLSPSELKKRQMEIKVKYSLSCHLLLCKKLLNHVNVMFGF